jgi:hypothetical protein
MTLTPVVKFLQHNFEIENKDGSRDTITSTLCEYGSPIGSGLYLAMAKLVGIPCRVGESSNVATIFLWFGWLFRWQRCLLSTSSSLAALSIALPQFPACFKQE